MKLVINTIYGGFSLSEKAETSLRLLKPGWKGSVLFLERNDPDLVTVVEQHGLDAGGRWSVLKVVEVPDNVNWYVEERDGKEWVAEVHRMWS